MTTVKFKRIYGSKSYKYVPRKKWDDTKIIIELSKQWVDTDNFIRYLIESESMVEETSSSSSEVDVDDDVFINFNVSSLGMLGMNFPQNPETFDLRDTVPLRIPTSWPTSNDNCNPRKKKVFKNRRVHEGISHNFLDFINQRNIGMLKNPQTSINHGFGICQLTTQFRMKETLIDLPPVNKIFCSKWLNDDQVLMGTKSNDLLLYNINSKKVDYIPRISNDYSESELKRGGIRSIDLNPSKTFLCTNAQNNADIAIYKLPTLDPIHVAGGGHSDLAFDMCWLDDQIFMSVSRDNSIAVWKVDDNNDSVSEEEGPVVTKLKPLEKKPCRYSDRLRSLVFNKKQEEAAVLSFNSNLHIFDTHTLKQIISQRLEQRNENVCLAVNDECTLYAVGSKTHATLIDPRTLQTVHKFDITPVAPSIRSISFQEHIVTFGTGVGKIILFDLKANAVITDIYSKNSLHCTSTSISSIEASVFHDQGDVGTVTPSAIYTHCYDRSGTKLFAAGGPLSSIHSGHYSALWY